MLQRFVATGEETCVQLPEQGTIHALKHADQWATLHFSHVLWSACMLPVFRRVSGIGA